MQVWRGRICQRSGEHAVRLWRGTAESWWSPAVCAALLLAACDLPTKPPKLQNRLLLGTETTVVPVTELLPAGVQVVGSTFRVQLASATLVGRSLAEMCGASCIAPPGVQVPKPAFTDSSEVR